MKGNGITVPRDLKRVALLGGPTGQIAYILGVQDRLCAVTGSIATSELINIFDPSIANRPVVRTVSGSVNVEELIKSNAQLVIAGDIDGEIVSSKTAIPVAYFDDSMGDRLDAIKRELLFYASVFEAEKRADAYNSYLDSMIALINERTSSIPDNERKVIYNGYNSNHLVTLGGDTFMQERIELAGCINAAEEIRTSRKQEGLHSGLGEVSMELVLKWNPDIIVMDMGSLKELKNDSRWNSIKAVKNGRVYTQPAGAFIWDRPTAEAAVLHPLWMAMTAYPEKFKDISFRKEVKRFYKEIFGFNLTDKHARMIEDGSFRVKIMKGVKSQ
jgi:iron complex transport system substrate-binding protein